MAKHYAVIENVMIPADHRLLMNDIAYVMDRNLYTFRSSFQGGIEQYILFALQHDDDKQRTAEVFHDGRPLKETFEASYIRIDTFPNWEEAVRLVEHHHPDGANISRDALADQLLLTYKLLGVDLKTPVTRVYAYITPEGSGDLYWLLHLVRKMGAVVINLYDEKTRHKVEDFVMNKVLFD